MPGWSVSIKVCQHIDCRVELMCKDALLDNHAGRTNYCTSAKSYSNVGSYHYHTRGVIHVRVKALAKGIVRVTYVLHDVVLTRSNGSFKSTEGGSNLLVP